MKCQKHNICVKFSILTPNFSKFHKEEFEKIVSQVSSTLTVMSKSPEIRFLLKMPIRNSYSSKCAVFEFPAKISTCVCLSLVKTIVWAPVAVASCMCTASKCLRSMEVLLQLELTTMVALPDERPIGDVRMICT